MRSETVRLPSTKYFSLPNIGRLKYLFLLLNICLSYNCLGEDIREIYKSNKHQIHSKHIFVKDGTVFAYGFSPQLSNSEMSKDVAIEEAKDIAMSNFLLYNIFKVDWPANTNQSLNESLYREYLSITGGKVDLKNAALVERGFNESGAFCVMAVDESLLKLPEVSYKDLVYALTKVAIQYDNRLNYSLILEICSDADFSSIRTFFAKQLGNTFGNNVQALVLGNPVDQMPNVAAISKTNRLNPNTSFPDLYKLLQSSPYDPVICYTMGKKYEDIGRVKTASIFYERGSVFLINQEYNKMCLAKLSPQVKQKDVSFDDVLGLLKKHEFDFSGFALGNNATVIAKSYGTYPLADSRNLDDSYIRAEEIFYSTDPNVSEAHKLYLLSLENKPTAKNCNMVGCCFRISGKYMEAFPFLLQALKIDINQFNPLANLVVCLEKTGHIAMAKKYSEIGLKTSENSDWANNIFKGTIEKQIK